jgi:hypothetical protein
MSLIAHWDNKSTRQFEGSDSIVMFNSGYSPTDASPLARRCGYREVKPTSLFVIQHPFDLPG